MVEVISFILLIFFILFMGASSVCFIGFAENSDKNVSRKLCLTAVLCLIGAVIFSVKGSWLGAVGLLGFGLIFTAVMAGVRIIVLKLTENRSTQTFSLVITGFFRNCVLTVFFLLTATGVFSYIYNGLTDVGMTYLLTQDNYCLMLWWVAPVVFALISAALLISDDTGRFFKLLVGYLVFSALSIMIIGDIAVKVFGGSITQVVDVINGVIGGKGYPTVVVTALSTVMKLSSVYVICLALGFVASFVISAIKQQRHKPVG